MLHLAARRSDRTGTHRRIAISFIAVFLAGICLVAAGRGNLGGPTATASGGGTLVTTTVDTYSNFLTIGTPTGEDDYAFPRTQSVSFSVMPTPGETATAVVSRLINAINLDANFTATMIGVGTTTFEVTRTGGLGDVAHLVVTETDPGFQGAGVSFNSPGRRWVAINRVVSLNGNGNYRLIIDADTGTDYDQTFNTTTSPTNTVAGLNTSLDISLAQAGFCTFLDAATGQRYIQKYDPKVDVKILSANVSATDTALSSFTVELTDSGPISPSGSCSAAAAASSTGAVVPTLSEYGLFVLVALLTGAALLVLRRKGSDPVA